MATNRKKSHAEREAEVAKRLGLSYTKDLPISATRSGKDGVNVVKKTVRKKTKKK